jgi:hypothetical protein
VPVVLKNGDASGEFKEVFGLRTNFYSLYFILVSKLSNKETKIEF